jgi:hypothetical protein
MERESWPRESFIDIRKNIVDKLMNMNRYILLSRSLPVPLTIIGVFSRFFHPRTIMPQCFAEA